MKFYWKNIENWWSWKMSFFWFNHFEFFFWIFFFCFISTKTSSPFIWGIIYFCTMDDFFRILEKTSAELICRLLYKSQLVIVMIMAQILALSLWQNQYDKNRAHKKYEFWPKLKIATNGTKSMSALHILDPFFKVPDPKIISGRLDKLDSGCILTGRMWYKANKINVSFFQPPWTFSQN